MTRLLLPRSACGVELLLERFAFRDRISRVPSLLKSLIRRRSADRERTTLPPAAAAPPESLAVTCLVAVVRVSLSVTEEDGDAIPFTLDTTRSFNASLFTVVRCGRSPEPSCVSSFSSDGASMLPVVVDTVAVIILAAVRGVGAAEAGGRSALDDPWHDRGKSAGPRFRSVCDLVMPVCNDETPSAIVPDTTKSINSLATLADADVFLDGTSWIIQERGGVPESSVTPPVLS